MGAGAIQVQKVALTATFLDEGSNCAWPLSDPVPESGKFYRRELPYKKDTGGAPGSRLPGIARVASRF